MSYRLNIANWRPDVAAYFLGYAALVYQSGDFIVPHLRPAAYR